MGYNVTLDLGELEHMGGMLADGLSDACTMTVRSTIKAGVHEALTKRTWKDRTGSAARRTKAVMLIEARGGAWGEVRSTADYASYLDKGTAPHVIEGNPYLHFVWKGIPMTLRRVHHPGTKGDGYMGYAFLKMELLGQAEMERQTEILAARLERRLNAAA